MEKGPGFVDQRHAKSSQYAQDLTEIQAQGVCPLCPDVFPGKWHTNPVLNTIGSWLITRNMHPYAGASEHFLLVGKEHKQEISKLTAQDFFEVLSLAQWATAEFNLPGALLAIRFGESKYTGATVTHIHAHLIVPGEVKGKIQVVNFPIG